MANYLADFRHMHRLVYDATGIEVQIFRFPGGSINSYNADDYPAFIAEMLRRGFTFYDWNVSGAESSRSTPDSIREGVLSGVAGQSRSIVLMHDAGNSSDTVRALSGILDALLARVYGIEPLTAEVEPIWFSYDSDI